MADIKSQDTEGGLPLGWRGVAARAAMAWEAAWPALAPAAGLAGLFVALALTDWLPALPELVHAGILALFMVGFLVLLSFGVRRLRWPTLAQARRRVELASGLRHRPLSALIDEPVGNDPMAQALWRAHRARLLAQIRSLRVGAPRAGLLAQDPRGLRVALALVLVISVAAGWGELDERMRRAITPGVGAVAALPPTLDLWITPPAYTGVAPLFVTGLTGDQKLSVPVGSQLLGQVNRAGRGIPSLVLGGERLVMTQVDPGAWRVESPVERGESLAVVMGSQTLGSWPMTVIPDRPPTIALKGQPDKTDRAALKLEYQASDDYGIDRATAMIRRPEGGEPLSLPLGGLAGRREGQGTLIADLTVHPWAGLPVELVLTVVDVAGQTGQTEAIALTLPERDFKHPVAKAVIAQRKNLVREPAKRRDIAQALGRIAAQPALYADDGMVFMGLMSARARLFLDRDGSSIEAVQSLLWDIALRVEDGDLGVQERDLRAAEQALRDALDRNAGDEEIQRLIDQLQAAIDKYLEQMIRQAMENPQRQQIPRDRQNSRTIDRRDLQKMLDQTRDAAKRGQRDQARAMLDRLQQLMENLRNPQMAEDGDQDGDENSEAMQALQDIESLAQRQRDLMDRGMRQQNRKNQQQAQRNRQRGQQGQQGQRQPGQPGQEGQQGEQGEGEGDDEDGDMAGDQEELRRQLGDAMRRLGEAMGNGNMPGGLGKAERSMRGASDALRRGQPGQAQGPQGDAVDQLREAARNMMDQMQQGQGEGPGMGNPDGRLRNRADSSRPRDQGRDPLGRPTPNATGVDTGDIAIPEDNQAARSREIFEELRRRAGDPLRPSIEREYIDRLMRRF